MSILTDILKEIPLSAVLRERLSEAESKMAALEKENAILKTENAILKTENETLRMDLQKAHTEIETLKNLPKPSHIVITGGIPKSPGMF